MRRGSSVAHVAIPPRIPEYIPALSTNAHRFDLHNQILVYVVMEMMIAWYCLKALGKKNHAADLFNFTMNNFDSGLLDQVVGKTEFFDAPGRRYVSGDRLWSDAISHASRAWRRLHTDLRWDGSDVLDALVRLCENIFGRRAWASAELDS